MDLRGLRAGRVPRRPRLTLNYGLRYEVNQPFAESQNHLNAFHPGQQSTVFPNAPTGLVYPGDAGVPRGTYPTDKNNVAPRLAAIWDVTRRRPHQRARARGASSTTRCRARATSSRTARSRRRSSRSPQVDYPGADSVRRRRSAARRRSASRPGLIFIGWGPDFTTPMVQHYNVTVQRQVGDYWGARGRLRRIARLPPADLHGGQPDDPDSHADADRSGRASVPGVQPRAADVLGRRVLVQLAAGQRAHAAVARR